MISNKYLNIIVIAGVSIALLFSAFLIINNPPSKTFSNSKIMEYETKLFDKDKIMEINIEINENDWNWLIENATREEYRNCNVIINGEKLYNVGIRPKGNSSLSMVAGSSETDRFSFKLNFDEYVDGQTFYGLDKLSLNNIMADNSYMKEAISYGLFSTMGVKAPLYNYSNIKINDKEWGFYIAVENIEESFLIRNYGNLNGNLYKPEGMGIGGNKDVENVNREDRNGFQPNNGDFNMRENNNQIDNQQRSIPGFFGGGMGSSRGGSSLVYNGDDISNYSTIREGAVLKTTTDKDFENVITMIKHLDSGVDLEKYLDVDQVLRHIAVNTFIVNLDSYFSSMKHNYYLYEEDGVFQLLPWDYNLAFGGFQSGDATSVINFPVDLPVTGDDEKMSNTPLVGKLLAVDKYKEKYHSYLEEIINNYIKNGLMEKTIETTSAKIDNYVKNDASAFCTYDEYKKAVKTLIQYCYDRAESIALQLNGKQPSTSTGNYVTNITLSDLGSMGHGGDKGGFGNKPDEQNKDEQNNINNNRDMMMPNFENMEQIMEIIESSQDGNFTKEQLEELEKLGVTEEMVKNFKNMHMGVREDGFDINLNQRNFGGPNINQASLANNNSTALITIISIILFIFAYIFVIKFKVRKYKTL